jgi:hypothetical protein
MTRQKGAGGGSNSLPPLGSAPTTPTPFSEDVLRTTDRPVPSDDGLGHDRIPCAEALDMIGDYLGHELTTVKRDKFVNHIRTCELCHRKLLTIEIQLHLAATEDRAAEG